MLDGWDATKPRLQAAGFVSYQSSTGVTDPRWMKLGCPIHRASFARWVGRHEAQVASSRFCFLSVLHRRLRPAMDETLGAPSIERLLLDGWDATKPRLQAAGFVSYQSFTGIFDPTMDETLGCPIHRASFARWVGCHEAQIASSRFCFLSVLHRHLRPAMDETLGCPIHRASFARWVGRHVAQVASSRFCFLSVLHRRLRPADG